MLKYQCSLLKLKWGGTLLSWKTSVIQCNFVLFDEKEMHVYYFFKIRMYVWMFSLRVNRSLVKTWDVKVWFDPTKTAIGAKFWRETKERERCTRNRESRRSRAARRATKIPAIFSLVEIGDSSQCKSNHLIKVELLFQKIKNSHFERTLFCCCCSLFQALTWSEHAKLRRSRN